MNGSGKTSLLQAIAATLGTATGRLQKIPDLEWAGFNYELLGNNWENFNQKSLYKYSFPRKNLKQLQSFTKNYKGWDTI